MLAYAVGFGGSMIWFGSSAGVALSAMYPQAKSVGAWLRHGWFVIAAYVAGFFFMLALWGWQPTEKRVRGSSAAAGITLPVDASTPAVVAPVSHRCIRRCSSHAFV
jgi:hypothetical protein